ncbi:MAG: hypothetical protein HY301_02315 [Verrucomicrobia bacterium]|nr:hypothetical protein [Verrucomicrobiota bacterium]
MRGSTIITLFVCGLLVISCGRKQPPSASVFQMRLVQDALITDTEQLTIFHSLTYTNDTTTETLNVQKKVLLDETAVRSASVKGEGPPSAPEVEIVLTENGQKLFADLTRQSVGRRLAIVVDGKLLVAPRIEMEIAGGRVRITGRFSLREAIELATKINDAVKK